MSHRNFVETETNLVFVSQTDVYYMEERDVTTLMNWLMFINTSQ